jgi:SagB-type dehydrogenase family enzyme
MDDLSALGVLGDTDVIERFLEASKVSRWGGFPSNEAVLHRMRELAGSLQFLGYEKIELPLDLRRAEASLSKTIQARRSCRKFDTTEIDLGDLATILHLAYGESQKEAEPGNPWPFRMVPSGGALYPLELFVFVRQVQGLPPGLYHYHAISHTLRRIVDRDLTSELAQCFVQFQEETPRTASAIIAFASMFQRSTFKYGARGVRFSLIEAGHVAQNMNLVATALGLATLDIGGYFDDKIDNLIGLDGVTQSTIYMVAIGNKG